eukprot:6480643-Amphidinium_carterae.1
MAPASLSCCENRASEWLTARSELGLSAGDGCPLMSAGPSTSSKRIAMANADINARLRAFVSKAVPRGSGMDLSRYGSHSCKRTTLHWLAAAGASIEDRRLLGHHVLRSDGSWLAYSRDALQTPMVKYTKTVERVMSGSLRVDGSSLDVYRHCEEHEVESVHTPTVLAEGSPHHTECGAECPPCASRSLDVDSQQPARGIEAPTSPDFGNALTDSSSGSDMEAGSDIENLVLADDVVTLRERLMMIIGNFFILKPRRV